MECTHRSRSWWKLCRHGEFQDDLYDVSQFEVGILLVRELFYQSMMLLDPDKRWWSSCFQELWRPVRLPGQTIPKPTVNTGFAIELQNGQKSMSWSWEDSEVVYSVVTIEWGGSMIRPGPNSINWGIKIQSCPGRPRHGFNRRVLISARANFRFLINKTVWRWHPPCPTQPPSLTLPLPNSPLSNKNSFKNTRDSYQIWTPYLPTTRTNNRYQR